MFALQYFLFDTFLDVWYVGLEVITGFRGIYCLMHVGRLRITVLPVVLTYTDQQQPFY